MKNKLKQLKNENGSVSIVIAGILFVVVAVSLVVMKYSGTNLQTAYNYYMKNKSNGMVDFAVSEYKSRLLEFIENDDFYSVPDANPTDFDLSNFTLNDENGEKKLEITFGDILLEVNGTEYKYMDDILNRGAADDMILYKNIPIDDFFENKIYSNFNSDIQSYSVVDNLFNRAYQSNEFYVLKNVFDDGTYLGSNIYSHLPLIENDIETPLFNIAINTFNEKIKDATGINNALSAIDLNDDITLSSTWDDTFNSPKVFVSFTDKKNNRIYVFTGIPLIDKTLNFYDVVEIDGKILKAEVKTNYEASYKTTINVLNVLTQKDGQNHFISYQFNDVLAEEIDNDGTGEHGEMTTYTFPQKTRNFSSSLYTNQVLGTTELMVFTVEDSVFNNGTENIPIYNNTIGAYRRVMLLDDNLAPEQEEKVIDGVTTTVDKKFTFNNTINIHSLGSSVFWDTSLNDGKIMLMFGTSSKTDVFEDHKLYSLETSVINSDITDIVQVDTASLNVKNIGRISVAGISHEYGEVLAFLEKSLLQVDTVTVKPADPDEYMVEVHSYEDKQNGDVRAKTKIKFENEINLYTTNNTNTRYVEGLKFDNMEIN